MPNINAWIESQLKKGVSERQLKKSMKKKGYSQKLIDAVDEIETLDETTWKRKQIKKETTIITAILIIVIALGAGAYFTYNIIHVPTQEEIIQNLSKVYGEVVPMQIVGNSMEPTFSNGDIVFVAPGHYLNNSILKNDVVQIKFNLNNTPVIKRIFATQTSEIDLKNLTGSVLLNQLERYDYKLPPDFVIILGDNAEESFDSRQHGIVAVSRIKGKIVG